MERNQPISEEARALILEFGWNSTCYQLLNQGIDHWWTEDRRGLVGYVRSGNMAIVAGAPVCAGPELARTIRSWELFVESQGMQVCYFGAEARLQCHLKGLPQYVSVNLGCQPEWDPNQFVRAVEDTPSLRAQINRAKNKGVVVREWTRSDQHRISLLTGVLAEWLENKGLPPLHFLVEPDTLGNLKDRRIFVAEVCGNPVGFVTLCPIPAQNGWLTEQFVRSTSAPNGTIELALYASAVAAREMGSDLFTMGIVPLLTRIPTDNSTDPTWLKSMRRWAQAHYSRFYNFRGLCEFKSKFRPPDWQEVVVIIKDDRFKWKHLRAIGRAFARKAPELAALQGLWKAAELEADGLARSLLSWKYR